MRVLPDVIYVKDVEIDRSLLTSKEAHFLCTEVWAKVVILCPKTWEFPNVPELLALFKRIGIEEGTE